jgi:hypothetical protein
MRLALIVTVAAACLAPLSVGAQVVPLADRPLLLTEGIGVLALDVRVGLNAGHAGAVAGVDSGLAHDRAPGLSVAYGVARRIEIGASMPYVFADYDDDLIHAYDTAMKGWPLRRNVSSRNHFGPVQIWGRFGLLDWAGFDVALLVPLEGLRSNRVAFRVGVPLKWTLIPGRLALRAQPDLVLGFGRSDMNLGASIQASFFLDASLIVNLMRALYLEAGLGYGRMIAPGPDAVVRDWHTDPKPSGAGYLPVWLSIGYSVTETIDLTAGFSLGNLTPGSDQGPADSRSVTVGVSYRF